VSIGREQPSGRDRSATLEAGREVRIGPYRLIREIGRGGMGTVYLAVRADAAFEKHVAIKVLRRGMDSDAIEARFRTERQILASLEHPNIAGLFDGGATADGLPYFAMEYVEGRPIVEDAEARGLDTTARLDLFRQVCAAVQYAHQNLVIHRDIKPANVLVTPDGAPKLLDFGIAKLLTTDGDGHTIAPTFGGLQLMTPEYASPEQVRGEAVTTATDVYSLGVLLYELLTGRRPYRITSRAPQEVARVICESAPLKPSTVVTHESGPDIQAEALTGTEEAGLPPAARPSSQPRTVDVDRLRKRLAGDLDTIVLKALSKEPSRRYASVDQLSEDIRRHLAGLPVTARPDTFTYRASKFVRRHRGAVTATALLFIALVAGVVGTAWQAREARLARARAEARFDDVRQLANAFLFELHDAIRDLPGSTPARRLVVTKGLEYLDRLAREAGDRRDLQRELAGAYVKVGDVQGRPLNPNIGDTAGALASYRKAASIYDVLGAASSPDVSLQREVAIAWLRLSELLTPAGDTAGALTYARRALAIEDRVTTDASPADARRALAAAHSRVGDLLSATGDTAGALAERRRTLSMMQAIAASTPRHNETQRQLGVAHQRLGNQLGNPNYPNVGDSAGALVEIERAVAIFNELAAANPDNALYKRLVGVIHSNYADILRALNRIPESLTRQRQSLAAFQALAGVDASNVAAQNDVAIGRSKVAELLDLEGEPAEARREYEAALAIHQRLAALDPQNTGLRLEVASDYNRLATLQTKQRDRAAALENHSFAVTMTRALDAAAGGNVEYRVALALALSGRGDAYALFARATTSPTRADDLALAERDYAEAVALYTTLDQQGHIQGTDKTAFDNTRKELARIRAERGASR
jgi:eukaryotic-like serine/threonine-protein kinase